MKMTSSQLCDLRLGHYMITSEAIKHKIKNDRLNQIFFGRLNTHCTKKISLVNSSWLTMAKSYVATNI